MALGTFIAGPYKAYWSDTEYVLGIVEDGFEMELNWKAEIITGDNLGDTPQDGVHRGGELFLNFVLEEALLDGVKRMIWPFDSDDPGDEGEIADIGKLLTTTGKSFTLKPYIQPGIKYYFYNCIIADNFPIRQILAARLRKVPVRLQVFPQVVGADLLWYLPTPGWSGDL